MRIFTLPRTPRTMRITSEWDSRGGMKSVMHTSPSLVMKVVSRIIVPGR